MAATALDAPKIVPWKSVGVWMAALLAVSQLVNAGRAVANPTGFADYFGLPLEAPGDAGLLYVYALRATFLGLFALFLIARQEFATLKWFALIAVLMPIGDFLLAWNAGAPTSTVGRHAGYVAYMLILFVLLHRLTSRQR